MPDNDFREFDGRAQADRTRVEARLEGIVVELASQHEGMCEAIRYSLLGGGKRLRPILCLWTHDSVGGNRPDAALDVACAIECLHTYSLVHDDLPCMDDDDLRRGQPSSHRRFGESTAVLVGDALLNLSYEVLSSLRTRHADVAPDEALECIRVLSRAAGTGGLITGQALDLDPESDSEGEAGVGLVERIQENKTARLIAASLELGAIIGGADRETRQAVSEAGTLAGAAFQIADDLLDIEKDEVTLGKTPGKDIKNGKLTYPSVVGLEGARSRAAEQIAGALERIPGEEPYGPVRALLRYLVDRQA